MKFDTFEQVKKIVNNTQETINNTTSKMESIMHENSLNINFCSCCGESLNKDANFCYVCGSAVNTTEEDGEKDKYNSVDFVRNCPNCSGVLNHIVGVCPYCGVGLLGIGAPESVKDFKNQLMLIENSRKVGSGGLLGAYLPPDSADVKKLTLIRNFPIPNTIDDILEFMMLAIANIDVSLSKNTLWNKWNNAQTLETAATINRTISNAWVAKMQQLYRKAEVAFYGQPEYRNVEKMYLDKMKELNMLK